MQHRSLRGEVAVDTSKFESWPLLRPDELTRLPTEVLRASVSDLDTMCQQASGKDKRGADFQLSLHNSVGRSESHHRICTSASPWKLGTRRHYRLSEGRKL